MTDIVHPPHQFQNRDLARGRQRGFRLVEGEDVQALTAFFEEAEKAFAVGEWERKSGDGPLRGSRAASSRYLATEKKRSARKNQPLVIFGSQLARSALKTAPHHLDRT
jgi:hypothetical protein